MNKIYVYDGSFLSLINLIIYLIDKNIKPDNIREEDYNPNLFEEIINLDIGNNITIDKFFEMFGSNVFSVIYYVFLSSDENKELILFYFCYVAAEIGSYY